MAVGFVLCLCLAAARAGLAADGRPIKSLLEMRHEHVVIQKFDLSCGAAALATLLNYQYSDPVSEREVAKELIRREEYLQNPALVNIRQGFSLLDLKRYVEQRGYEGIGYGKLTLEDLIERAPVMVPIDTARLQSLRDLSGRLGRPRPACRSGVGQPYHAGRCVRTDVADLSGFRQGGICRHKKRGRRRRATSSCPSAGRISITEVSAFAQNEVAPSHES